MPQLDIVVLNSVLCITLMTLSIFYTIYCYTANSNKSDLDITPITLMAYLLI
jgi:hypothetical protein